MISFFFCRRERKKKKNGHTQKKHHHRASSNHHVRCVEVLDDFVPIDRSGGQGHRAPRERRWRRRKRSVVLRPSRDDDDGPAAGRQSGSGVRRRWRASSRETHGRESVVRDARSGCFFVVVVFVRRLDDEEDDSRAFLEVVAETRKARRFFSLSLSLSSRASGRTRGGLMRLFCYVLEM